MTLPFPFPKEVNDSLSETELNVLKEAYEKEGNDATPQTKVNYAWGLIRTSPRKDQAVWLLLLDEVKDSHPEYMDTILYYGALGQYQLGNYTQAKTLNNLVLQKDEKNIQAKALASMINSKVSCDGFNGILIVSTVIVAVAVGVTIYNRYYRQ